MPGQSLILLVEEDASLRAALARLLRDSGFAVQEAGSFTRMKTLVTDSQARLLVADASLADEEGADILRHTLNRRDDLVALLLGLRRRRNLAHHDRIRFLQKPIDDRELIGAVRALLPAAPEFRAEYRDQTPTVASTAGLEPLIREHLERYFAQHHDGLPPDGLYKRLLPLFEVPLIETCLLATRGNRSKAAQLLGLNRNTLAKKLDYYKIGSE